MKSAEYRCGNFYSFDLLEGTSTISTCLDWREKRGNVKLENLIRQAGLRPGETGEEDSMTGQEDRDKTGGQDRRT